MKEEHRTKSRPDSAGSRGGDEAPVGLALISPEGRFLQVNRRLCALLGYTRTQLLRTTLAAVTHPDDLHVLASQSRRLLAGEIDEMRLEQRFLRADGRHAPGRVSASFVADDDDRSFACVLEMDEARVRAPEGVEAFGLVLDDFLDGVMATDATGRIASFNRAARGLFGYERDEVLGRAATLIIAEPYHEMFASCLATWMRPGRDAAVPSASREMWGRRKDGSTFPVEFRGTRLCLGGEQHFVAILRDISEQKAQTEALEYQTLHDALTSLPNRTLLNDRLHQAILAGSRQRKPAAVLVMDVDGFKEVNDAYGHHVGDQLLQQIALRLECVLRGSDTVARLGGDEFAILPLTGMGGEDGAMAARKVLKALEPPFMIDDRSIRITASIGIAAYPADGHDAPTLMRHADAAMYMAKRTGSGYAVYAPRQGDVADAQPQLAGELRHAILHDELLIHFQPKVDLRIGKTIGVEALVRWQHPKQGLLPPGRFIPVAEETDLIRPLTEWVLSRALHQSRSWRESGLDLDVAVNLSARNLIDPDLPARAKAMLEACGVDACNLKVDIPERSIMTAPVIETARHLGALGIGLAIDDFGTGLSSLTDLTCLPVREIKLDRAFITANLGREGDAILRHIVDLGHTMGMGVVAEGVEDQGMMDRLQGLGCDSALGFHLCPPTVAADLTPWLRHSALGVAESAGPRGTR